MIQELVSPLRFVTAIKKRIEELESALVFLQKNQENSLPGHLKISRKENHLEFYHISEQGSSPALVDLVYTPALKLGAPLGSRIAGPRSVFGAAMILRIPDFL